MRKQPIKLSELPDEVEVSYWHSNMTYTVSELKRKIELGEPHHETKNWAVIGRAKWKPCAESMIEYYIDSEADNLYEDADERIKDGIGNEQTIAAIQAILDAAMPGGLDYWEYGKDVEIDIFPPDKSEEAAHE